QLNPASLPADVLHHLQECVAFPHLKSQGATAISLIQQRCYQRGQMAGSEVSVPGRQRTVVQCSYDQHHEDTGSNRNPETNEHCLTLLAWASSRCRISTAPGDSPA